MTRTSVLLLLLLAVNSQCGKILIYSPLFGHSHSNFLGHVADTLVEAGHNVTVLMPIIDTQLMPKTGVKKAKVVLIDVDPRTDALQADSRGPDGRMRKLWTLEPSPVHMMAMVSNMSNMFSWQCEKVLNDRTVLSQLREENFDLAIAEPFDACGYGVIAVLGIRNHVSACSSGLLDNVAKAIGVPILPSYVPVSMGATSDKMSLLERAKNAGQSLFATIFFDTVQAQEEELIRQHLPDFPGVAETIARSSFVFTNANPLIDFPHPVIHKVIEIGGISVPPAKKLEKTFDEALNKKKHTVFVSFGSVAKSIYMPDKYRLPLINVFRSLPDVQFIWKYEDPEAIQDKVPDNVLLTKWAPQTDLLVDPRLSLFITHGGLGSVTENAYRGKPSIVIPIFADQLRNSRMLERHGGAIVLRKTDLDNESVVKAAIEKALADESLAASAAYLAEVLEHQPIDAKQLLVKNIEFTMRFGPLPQLDPHGRSLSFVQYFLLDVLAAVAAVVLSILLLVYWVVRKTLSLCGVNKVLVYWVVRKTLSLCGVNKAKIE